MQKSRVTVFAFAGALVIGGYAFAAPEIVVTATRTEKSIYDVPSNVEVIDRTKIDAANASSVDELFKTLAGVDLQGSGVPGSAVRFNMRGLTPGYQTERVLVLVDGRRINDQYQGNTELALLPADCVERIEILRGPASALYGSNAMGGVINIVTRKGKAGGKPLEIRALAGSDATRDYRLNYGGLEGVVDYFVTASHVETDGYMDNSDGTDRDWLARNITGNLGVKPDEEEEVRFFFGQYTGEGTDENSDREVRKDYEAVVYSRQWDVKSQARLKARLYRNGEDYKYDWKYPGEGIYEQYTVGSELEQSLWLNDANLSTFGVEARKESVDIDEVQNRINEDNNIRAFYAQDEIHVLDMAQITLGARDDYNLDYGDEISPRVGLLWHVSPDAELFASVNRAHRAPALSDRFVKVIYNGMTFEGNPDLDPESLTAYETGVRKRFDDRVSTELAVFDNHMKDTFDFMMDPDGVFRARNATRVRTYGSEADIRCKVTDMWSVFMNYSFTEGYYDEFLADPSVEGNDLAYLAKNKANAGLSCETGSFSHSLAGRYVGSRYADPQNTAGNKMGEYIVADWRSRVQIADFAWLILNVDNIFDREYKEFPAYDQPGLRIMGGVEMFF